MWRYKVENRADSHQALHIQVTSLPSASSDVLVRVWTNQDSQTIIDLDDHRPIIIYGEVKVRNPMIDVPFYIYQNDTPINSASLEPGLWGSTKLSKPYISLNQG